MKRGIKTSRGKTRWYPSGIRAILTNEKYIGDLKQGKTYVTNYLDKKTKKNKGEREFVIIENHHEPIIEKEIFYKVQEELEKNKKIYLQNSLVNMLFQARYYVINVKGLTQ